MSRFVLKLNRIFLMLAVAVGIIFLVCAFTPSVPNGVEVDGIAKSTKYKPPQKGASLLQNAENLFCVRRRQSEYPTLP